MHFQKFILLSLCCLALGLGQTKAQIFQPTPITPPMVQAAQNGGAELPQPFFITNGERCFVIRCQTESCEDCALVWKDLNGDGQVQPRQELRCRCKTDGELECQIQHQEVDCP